MNKYDIDNLILDKIKTDYRNGEIPEIDDDPEEVLGDGGEPVGK